MVKLINIFNSSLFKFSIKFINNVFFIKNIIYFSLKSLSNINLFENMLNIMQIKIIKTNVKHSKIIIGLIMFLILINYLFLYFIC